MKLKLATAALLAALATASPAATPAIGSKVTVRLMSGSPVTGKLTRIEADGVTVETAAGLAKIGFAQMTPAMETLFGADPVRSAAAARAEEARQAALRRQTRGIRPLTPPTLEDAPEPARVVTELVPAIPESKPALGSASRLNQGAYDQRRGVARAPVFVDQYGHRVFTYRLGPKVYAHAPYALERGSEKSALSTLGQSLHETHSAAEEARRAQAEAGPVRKYRLFGRVVQNLSEGVIIACEPRRGVLQYDEVMGLVMVHETSGQENSLVHGTATSAGDFTYLTPDGGTRKVRAFRLTR